jgi:hypothetical protein
MNPSEYFREINELHIASDEYCFACVSEDLTILISTRGQGADDLVIAFVSYMKAVGFSVEAIEIALANQSEIMRSFRLPLRCETENTDEVPGPKQRLRVNTDSTWHQVPHFK